MTTPNEISNHLIDLNWAYFEQEQYRVDAYDQRNGQRWFLEAVGRVNKELTWFLRHQVMLGMSLEDPAHCFYVVSDEREALMTRERPTIVCLCGSTRFMEAFQAANLHETLAGKLVLSVGCDTKSDAILGLRPDVKAMLDELHKRKIDLADEIFVLDVNGYVGQSTQSEIEYACALGKRVRWLSQEGFSWREN